MRQQHNSKTRVVLFMVLALGPLSRLHAGEGEAVVVALRPSVKTSSRVLSIGDVADVYGSLSSLTQRIASLDILDNRQSEGPVAISQRQIRIRLLLDGIPGDSFTLAGAERCVIGPQTDPISDQLVIESIRAALVRRFQVADSDLDVRLAQPLPAMPDLAGVAPDDVDIEPYLPDELPRGRARIRLAVHAQGQLRRVLSVTLDVTEYREIAVATKAIRRGQLLSASDLKNERRPITAAGQYASLASAIGREAKRPLRPGDAIRMNDVADSREESPVLVKYRDTVRLVARKGRLAVTLSAAEALQQGRLGDTIRVRNADSKRVIVGKVVGPGELEVRF